MTRPPTPEASEAERYDDALSLARSVLAEYILYPPHSSNHILARAVKAMAAERNALMVKGLKWCDEAREWKRRAEKAEAELAALRLLCEKAGAARTGGTVEVCRLCNTDARLIESAGCHGTDFQKLKCPLRPASTTTAAKKEE